MKKVLSIDGGGIRGIIPTVILRELERRTGGRLHELFDLMAGTSMGGVTALFLSVPDETGTSARYDTEGAINLCLHHRNEIFYRSTWRQITSAAGLIDERYSTDSVESLFERYFGDVKMKDGLADLLITSYDLERRAPFFFKSWKADAGNVPMQNAARATSAAPTYFTPERIVMGERHLTLVDGGLFANNPAMCAYVEAVKRYPNEEIMLLSLGTGEMAQPIPYAEAKDWGMAEWAIPILDVVFDGISDTIDHQLATLLPETYFRLQKRLEVASESLDDISDENVAALEKEAHLIMEAEPENMARLYEQLTR